MSRWIAPALLLAMVASGCVAGDSAPETVSAAASEDDELRAARDRIALLETELAQTQGEVTEDADGSSHFTRWERQPVPRKFRAAGRGFRHPDTLLFSLADHLVDLR